MNRAEIVVDPASKIDYTPLACGGCRQSAVRRRGLCHTHVIA